MRTQDKFNDIFKNKNEEIDNLITKQWDEILNSKNLKKLYNNEYDLFDVQIEDSTFDLYWMEHNEYVLHLENNEEPNLKHSLYINTESGAISYELSYPEDSIYDYHDILAKKDNKDATKYIKNKAQFLEWSRNHADKIIHLVEQEQLILDDIEAIENIKV